MDHLRDQTLNLDSPSKQSYVGSFYMPPEKLSRPLYMNTVSHPPDRNISGLQEISPQVYRTVPDAGSRAVIAALKTLQEKMRRIELERAQAAKNAQHFSQDAQLQVNTSAQIEINSKERKNESSQKKELASKLRSAETRCSLLEKQLDYMKKMVACAETDSITQRERRVSRILQSNLGIEEPVCKEGTNTDLQIQAQLNKLERLEKEYLKLTSTQSEAERKIELLEQKLLLEEHQRKLVQDKAEELQRDFEKNLLSLSAATRPKGKKKKDKASCRSPSVKAEAAPPQFLPKAKRLPFVAGTSTSPSHSVNANVQSVLHMMKHRNPRLCERVSALQKSASENQRDQREPQFSPDKAASALGSLSEILLALQDELGQMSFEHQELVKQIDETDKRELRDDLERELDCLVRRMEEKATQISKLRKHQQTVQKLAQPPSSPRQKQQKQAKPGGTEDKTRIQSGVQAFPVSPVKASPSKGQKQCRTSQESLRLLRETQKLGSSLRRKDITWET
ncbi:centrosomal protein CEP57L1 isoform X2 [Misgurnus anguillicaudatus]|uniref:centrosomal protein CEP57L1 isoform X2 n=1 Tax=Misgurnus anguillicaudatus TaxID=75329 RepID=UPI0024348779|nr:centrosomal protein CEP57L1 isoform X2 [Misgurnus anguillicaudatus]